MCPRRHGKCGQKRDDFFHGITSLDLCGDEPRSIGIRCNASVSPLAEFSTTTSLIWTIGVTSVKLCMSPSISGACGPNDDWYSSTEPHSRWHMATYAAGDFPFPSAIPLSIV